MAKLQWFITRTFERIGLVGFIAILLVALIVFTCFYVYLPKQQQLISLKEQQAVKPLTESNTVYEYHSPADMFFSSLPAMKETPARLKVLFEQASKNTIFINEVQYKEQQLQGDELIRYDITFSVIASYPQIKAFIADALANLPSLALEQVTFNRDDASVETVMTQLRFSLFMVRQ